MHKQIYKFEVRYNLKPQCTAFFSDGTDIIGPYAGSGEPLQLDQEHDILEHPKVIISSVYLICPDSNQILSTPIGFYDIDSNIEPVFLGRHLITHHKTMYKNIERQFKYEAPSIYSIFKFDYPTIKLIRSKMVSRPSER